MQQCMQGKGMEGEDLEDRALVGRWMTVLQPAPPRCGCTRPASPTVAGSARRNNDMKINGGWNNCYCCH